MSHEEYIQSMRTMIGEAVMLGARLSRGDYNGLLLDGSNRKIVRSIDSLYSSTADFLAAAPLGDVSADDVLPLYAEIQELIRDKELNA